MDFSCTTVAALQFTGWQAEAFVRLLLAAGLGALVGLERELRGREAGFRTNLLVCLGSCLAMLVSMHTAQMPWVSGTFNISVDPGRIAYGVMTGIGFLGAGAILKQNAMIRGLTTAATIWCVAAVGLAIGQGAYAVGSFAAVLIVVALWLLNLVENVLPSLTYSTITIRTAWGPGVIVSARNWVREAGVSVHDVHFARTADLAAVDIAMTISYKRNRQLAELEHKLQQQTVYELIAITRA